MVKKIHLVSSTDGDDTVPLVAFSDEIDAQRYRERMRSRMPEGRWLRVEDVPLDLEWDRVKWMAAHGPQPWDQR